VHPALGATENVAPLQTTAGDAMVVLKVKTTVAVLPGWMRAGLALLLVPQ